MKSVRFHPSDKLTPTRIAEILFRGDRAGIEALMLRILCEPSVANQVEKLYSAVMPMAASDPEFTAGTAFEAAHRLAKLSKEIPS
jgi:hypothetical protein